MASRMLDHAAFERHYTVNEVARMWSLSRRTILRLFDKEAGVVVIGHTGNERRQPYRTMRIPESVMQRIYNRMRTPSR